ncbi:MAG: hypothetical protein WD825_10880 [Gemmatimonadaceae bacterium]
MLSRFVSLVVVGLALAVSSNRALHAQQLSHRGYPNVDKLLVVGAADTIRVLNRVMNDGGAALRPAGRRLDVQYATRIPAADSIARQEQADRAAQFFGADAVDLGVGKLSIGICDTSACAARHDPPAVWYLYERTSSGWKRSRP